MSGHTPGPWKVGYWLADPHDPSSKLRYVEGAGPKNPHTLRVAECATGDVTDDAEEANARLIAAAPEQNAALHAALKTIEGLAVAHFGPAAEKWMAENAAVTEIRAAIAKAEGGDS